MILFREAYKNAVDEVEINNALKEVLLIKAQNIPQKKTEAVSRYMYKVSAFAAAAAVAVFSVYAVSKKDIFSPEKNLTADIPVVTELKETPPEVKNEPVIAIEEIQPKTVYEPEMEEKALFENDAETDGIIFDTADTENALENSKTEDEGIASGGGSSAVSSARMAMAVPDNVEEWTLEEYYSYLGVNVQEALFVPQDMENTTGQILYISEDNDTCCFSYTGDGERFINVSTSKNTATAYEMLGGEEMSKQEHDGQAWAVTNSEDGYFQAVTVKEEISFYVDARDLTDEEEKNLIKSISSINCN